MRGAFPLRGWKAAGSRRSLVPGIVVEVGERAIALVARLEQLGRYGVGAGRIRGKRVRRGAVGAVAEAAGEPASAGWVGGAEAELRAFGGLKAGVEALVKSAAAVAFGAMVDVDLAGRAEGHARGLGSPSPRCRRASARAGLVPTGAAASRLRAATAAFSTITQRGNTRVGGSLRCLPAPQARRRKRKPKQPEFHRCYHLIPAFSVAPRRPCHRRPAGRPR